MSKDKHITCVLCPRGCSLTITLGSSPHDILEITGSGCAKGNSWAEKEIISPMRTLCTSILVTGNTAPLVSVKTDCEIPLESIPELMKEIRKLRIPGPVNVGQVLMENPAGIQCRIIATRSTQPLS